MLESLAVWTILATLGGLAFIARRYPNAFSKASRRVTTLAAWVLLFTAIISYGDLRSQAQILQYRLLADSTATLGSVAATIEAMNHSGLLLRSIGGVALLAIVALGFLEWFGHHRASEKAEGTTRAQSDN